jgi:hypothetical protein
MELASAPAEPVDFDVEALARECAAEAEVEHLYTYGPQMTFKAAEYAIRRTLAHRGARWPGDGRCKVPAGQTPLDDNLHHRLLDVIKEGQKARDNGTGSSYHGHSLEHCLHATGWVQRDLRLALDEAKAEIECLRAYQTGGDV